MRFYCPNCWHDFARDTGRCPHCGQVSEEWWQTKDYVEKLIVALNHPEPQTPIRAAGILGSLGDSRAVDPLMALIQSTDDVYIARAAVRALGRFDAPRVRRFLRLVRENHPAGMVREAALAASGAGDPQGDE